MKNVIKINKLATACILAGSLTMFSCSDFLNQEPKTSLTEQEAFSNLENIAPTVDGLYTAFRDSKSGREGLTFSLLGLDESKQGIVQMDDAAQASLDLYNGLLNSMSTQVDKMWSRRWPIVISAANAIYALDVLSETTQDEDTLDRIKRLKGEACFIRAMVMMELTMYWGEIPVVDIAKMENSARQPLEKVWKQIFDDFYVCFNILERKVYRIR